MTRKQIMRNYWTSRGPDEAVCRMNSFIEKDNVDRIISITEHKTADGYYTVVLYYYEPNKKISDDYRD